MAETSPPASPDSPALAGVGAASIWVLGQVAGPRRAATVLHSGRHAVHLDLGGRCVSVLTARAVQLPCGVRTDLPVLPELPPGQDVEVHDGTIGLPSCEVLVTTIVDAAVPVLSPEGTAWGADLLDRTIGDRIADARDALPGAALAKLGRGDAHAVRALLGLGPGLTPLGDDVLCGWLATAVACRHRALEEMRTAITHDAPQRTTTLSSTLLSCGARGEAVPELRTLLGVVATHDHAALEDAVEALLQVGESSGAGLLLGTVLALKGAA